MNIEVFVLCDAATDYQGKLNILGAFDAIWSKEAPVVNPHCAPALRVRFSKIEEGEHALRINIVDEDGQPVISPFEAKASINTGDAKTASIARNMILNLQGLTVKFLSVLVLALTAQRVRQIVHAVKRIGVFRPQGLLLNIQRLTMEFLGVLVVVLIVQQDSQIVHAD